jgi:hypothetical protein
VFWLHDSEGVNIVSELIALQVGSIKVFGVAVAISDTARKP